jgi:hypothetical protein
MAFHVYSWGPVAPQQQASVFFHGLARNHTYVFNLLFAFSSRPGGAGGPVTFTQTGSYLHVDNTQAYMFTIKNLDSVAIWADIYGIDGGNNQP